MTGTFLTTHVRNNANYSFTDGDPHSAAQEYQLPVAAPGHGWTLYRTRLMIEFRIFAYSISDSANPGFLWWRNLYPVVGVQAVAATGPILVGDLPMGTEEADWWVIWEALQGSADTTIATPGGFNQEVRVWRPQNHFLESFAQRTDFDVGQVTVLLGWEWNDPFDLIDRTHVTYDVVYDLNVTYGIDCFFKPSKN